MMVPAPPAPQQTRLAEKSFCSMSFVSCPHNFALQSNYIKKGKKPIPGAPQAPVPPQQTRLPEKSFCSMSFVSVPHNFALQQSYIRAEGAGVVVDDSMFEHLVPPPPSSASFSSLSSSIQSQQTTDLRSSSVSAANGWADTSLSNLMTAVEGSRSCRSKSLSTIDSASTTKSQAPPAVSKPSSPRAGFRALCKLKRSHKRSGGGVDDDATETTAGTSAGSMSVLSDKDSEAFDHLLNEAMVAQANKVSDCQTLMEHTKSFLNARLENKNKMGAMLSMRQLLKLESQLVQAQNAIMKLQGLAVEVTDNALAAASTKANASLEGSYQMHQLDAILATPAPVFRLDNSEEIRELVQESQERQTGGEGAGLKIEDMLQETMPRAA